MWAAVANGLWKVMSRSPSTTITRLRFISPGPAPQAATDAKVGTTFSGRGVSDAFVDEGEFLLVHRIGAHADAVGVEHHLAVGVGVFLAEIFQGHQLFVLDRHFALLSRISFFTGARCSALSPCGRGQHRRQSQTRLGEGLAPQTLCSRREPLIRRFAPPSPTRGEGNTHQAGVKNGSGAPSVGLNTTFTFWPILSLSMSQSTMLVCSDGPSFSVT